MHGTGPVSGRPFSLGLVAGAINPVALDSALLQILGLDPTRSVIWQECANRGLAGIDPAMLDFPLLKPAEISASNFKAPTTLNPVSFNPLRILISAFRRFTARVKESS
jgi:uncharacterized protein (DUF362 family)